MASERWMVPFAILIFVGLSFSYMVGVDRVIWFDEGFSLETMKIMDERKIDFSQYDVHPPVYYQVLHVWMSIPHGDVPERFWARTLSILFGMIFLLGAALFMRELGLSEKIVGMVAIMLAMGTTLSYYATEIRMYMLCMALAAWAMYALTRSLDGGDYTGWSVVWAGILVVLPFTHYFAVVFYPAFLAVQHILVKEKYGRRAAWINNGVALAIMVCATIASVVLFAIPQVMRIQAMYLPPPTMLSYISALFFSFHFTAQEIGGYWGLLLFFGFVVSLLIALWLMMKRLKEQKKDVRTGVLAVLMLTGLVMPFLGYIAGQVQTYHHRYFLVILWMFAIVFYVLMFEKWGWTAFLLFVIVHVMMWNVLVVKTDVEMREMSKWLVEKEGCNENIDVLHETTWTYVSFRVYAREWCESKGLSSWQDWLTTDITERLGRSAGEAAIDPERIFRPQGALPFDDGRSFYFIDVGATNGTIWERWKGEVVFPYYTANLTYVDGVSALEAMKGANI